MNAYKFSDGTSDARLSILIMSLAGQYADYTQPQGKHHFMYYVSYRQAVNPACTPRKAMDGRRIRDLDW